jgi:hypothetical protein
VAEKGFRKAKRKKGDTKHQAAEAQRDEDE